jgi:glycosyltransferase involved in cell wall biosynthesis
MSHAATRPDSQLPRITVVTPSFNQAQYIEATILSVIGQQYPNLEFLIMDGGSTDGTVDILRRYESHISYWQSQKDGGQAAAINHGFSRATGDVLGRLFSTLSAPSILFGNCLHFTEHSPRTRGSDVEASHADLKLELCDYIIQPSSFWNRSAWERTGVLNESFHFAFDWDWFIRAKRCGATFVPVTPYLSLYRIHDAHKSGTGGNRRNVELSEIYQRYSGERTKQTFARWVELSARYPFLRRTIAAANQFQLNLIHRILWMVLFPSADFSEYRNIVRM